MVKKARSIQWSLLEVEASKIYYSPVRKEISKAKAYSGSSVLVCPAYLKRNMRIYNIKAPFDLHLRCFENSGQPEIRSVINNTSVSVEKLKEIILITPREDWISRNKPIFQITTPYIFYSNFECYLSQTFPTDLLGLSVGFKLLEGRFPIHKWIRPLSWAVEWVDTSIDIRIKRGSSWFDLMFDTDRPEEIVSLEKKPLTKKIEKIVLSNSGVTNYIRGTSKLFEV